MATQLVKTMRAKVDPNPQGSATSHVTMPGANPFERETVSIRAANAPEMLPGMGDFWGDFKSGVTGGTTTLEGAAESEDSGWGSFFGKLTDSVVDVGTSFAKSEIQKQQEKDLIKSRQQQDLQTSIMNLLTAQQVSKMGTPKITQAPAVNPSQVPVIVQTPSSGGMGKSLPLIIGAVALVAVGGYFMLSKKKRRR